MGSPVLEDCIARAFSHGRFQGCRIGERRKSRRWRGSRPRMALRGAATGRVRVQLEEQEAGLDYVSMARRAVDGSGGLWAVEDERVLVARPTAWDRKSGMCWLR